VMELWTIARPRKRLKVRLFVSNVGFTVVMTGRNHPRLPK
jgi:hypothetical protein